MTQPFRTLLLAAGLGTRLRPITLNTPKCLVPIQGEPLLGRWLRQLDLNGCDSVLINTHYLAEEVEAFLKSWQSSTMSVETVYEPVLLGTAGTLLANQEFFRSGTGLLIHADNVMAASLKDFLAHIDSASPIASSPCLPSRPTLRVAAESSRLIMSRLFKLFMRNW